MNKNQKRILVIAICSALGLAAGMLLIRYTAMNRLEVAGWEIFWRRFPDVDYGILSDFIFDSSAFRKTVAGAIVGTLIGTGGGFIASKKL